MTSPSPASDRALLKEAALACGPLLRETFGSKVKTWSKGAAGPVTEIDLKVDQLLTERLRGARSAYGWLSEETADDPERLNRERIFIVDPIDGTLGFINGTPDFVVALAVVEGERPIAGVIYNPITEELYEASRGGGATLNGAPIQVSDTRTLEGAQMIGKRGFYEDRRWPAPWPAMTYLHKNAIAYRMALVGAGAADGMAAFGWKNEWDIAGAALIVEEAGGRVTDPWGGAHRYNQPDPRLPGAVAAGPNLHPLIIERVRFVSHPARVPPVSEANP